MSAVANPLAPPVLYLCTASAALRSAGRFSTSSEFPFESRCHGTRRDSDSVMSDMRAANASAVENRFNIIAIEPDCENRVRASSERRAPRQPSHAAIDM